MRHIKNQIRSLAAIAAVVCTQGAEALTFTSAGAGAESVYAVWEPVPGAVRYEASVCPEGAPEAAADMQLVRRYPDGFRVDIPGLAAGAYSLRIVARSADGTLLDEGVTDAVVTWPHVREGFAFAGGTVPGAYDADGVLKEGADVLYVSARTVNTVTLDVVKDKKGNRATQTGLAAILEAIGKGFHKTPLAVRIVGTVADTDFEGLKDGNYINLQGNNNTDRRLENVTVEGIGTDATLYGYGICLKRTHAIEVRNLAIMLFGDDAISMDTDNSGIWLHNIDFFYGRPGRDADQVKGDGSIDMKYRSTDITISFNHFFDSGKVMGCGGTTGEDENLRITFHHNWFDHADSRCPRLHYTTAHVYNNYYDGVPVYCIGNTTESSAFVESNYFRNCKRPLMISGQGTDAYDPKTGTYTLKGTFSGQAGGMTKAFDNIFAGNTPKLVWHTEHPTQFDAYLASSRDERVPESIVSVKGSWAYSNFDTDATMYASVPDAAADVPAIVTSRAGRVDGGDFKWTFDNAVDDEDHEVNRPLKEAVTAYAGRMIAMQGEDGFGESALTSVQAPVCGEVRMFDLNGRRLDPDSDLRGVVIVCDGEGVRKTVR